MVRTIDGIPRPIGTDKPPKGNGGVAGAAIALVLSAVAGGGAASVSRAVDEFGGSRISRSSEAEARANATSDSTRITLRLQRLGRGHPTVQISPDDSNCISHSYGAAHQFFRDNKCQFLTRMLVVSPGKDNVYLIATATIDMPDYTSAIGLQEALDQQGGGITELSRESGKYRNIAYSPALYKSTRHGATVITVQVQPVGRNPSAVIIDALLTDFLFSMGTSGGY